MLAKDYWFKANKLSESERAADAERRLRFRETNDPAALEGQTMTEGLFMMTLECEERCTVGGSMAAIPWKFVGQRLVEKTHRRATTQEIAEDFLRQDAYMVTARKVEDSMNNRKTISVQAALPKGPRGE